jgi:hypothetical protein
MEAEPLLQVTLPEHAETATVQQALSAIFGATPETI